MRASFLKLLPAAVLRVLFGTAIAHWQAKIKESAVDFPGSDVCF